MPKRLQPRSASLASTRCRIKRRLRSFAALSLLLIAKPVMDGLARSKQSRNMAMHDVPAPMFDTPDIQGKPQRLSDHKGKVVLVNIWATWV